jgi:hypothetical protein
MPAGARPRGGALHTTHTTHTTHTHTHDRAAPGRSLRLRWIRQQKHDVRFFTFQNCTIHNFSTLYFIFVGNHICQNKKNLSVSKASCGWPPAASRPHALAHIVTKNTVSTTIMETRMQLCRRLFNVVYNMIDNTTNYEPV